MSELVKAALIIAVALIVCAVLYVYYSPYNSCVRELKSSGVEERRAYLVCARELGGNAR